MILDVATVLRATGATVYRLDAGGYLAPGRLSLADLQYVFSGISIDSRAIDSNALFVALPGERVDGHDFVPGALAAGALGCLIARLPEPDALPAGVNGRPRFLFEVSDPLHALQRLAEYWRLHHSAEVVGVTGSIGKTTTKEIIASVLGSRYAVLRSEANLNTEIGLPLMLLRLGPQHRVTVLEMGMYQPGDVGLLAQMAHPRIGVVTNVAPIHLERVGSIERIARAKSELVAALPSDGLAVLNGDDTWTRAMAVSSGIAPSVLVGTAVDCAYRADDIVARGLAGTSFTLIAEGRRLPVESGIPGVHTIPAILMAAATARFLGMEWDEIVGAIETARLDVRQRIIRGPDGMLIIDDSYNAAPMSVNAALELLRAAPGTKIAVLGDMLELGPGEEGAHREVGRRAAQVVEWLVVRGERSAWIADEARGCGLPSTRVLTARDSSEAVEAVRNIVSKIPAATGVGRRPEVPAAYAVLVKGSRGMRMEEVVDGLRGEA
jgi:UDP-N-acetylmuramoyl-tripeptide--D-alanyl-D-alanine ligase